MTSTGFTDRVVTLYHLGLVDEMKAFIKSRQGDHIPEIVRVMSGHMELAIAVYDSSTDSELRLAAAKEVVRCIDGHRPTTPGEILENWLKRRIVWQMRVNCLQRQWSSFSRQDAQMQEDRL